MRNTIFIALILGVTSCGSPQQPQTYCSPTGTHEVQIINAQRLAFYNLEMDNSDTGNYRIINDSIIVNQKYMGRVFGDSLYLNGIVYTPTEPKTTVKLAPEDLVGSVFVAVSESNSMLDTLYFESEKLYYGSNPEKSVARDDWFLIERDHRQYLLLQNGAYKRYMLVKDHNDSGISLAYFQQNIREVFEITLQR